MVDESKLRVLVIAPEAPGCEPLAWLAEIGAIGEIEGVALAVACGPGVTAAAAARALRRGADVIIWSGHGRENGLLLGDGATVNGKWLATQVKSGCPRLAVIAACGSAVKDARLRSLVGELSQAGVNAIGFPLATADRAAVGYNVELVRALVAGADVGTAHEIAVEGIAAGDPHTAAGAFLVPGLVNGYRALLDRMEGFEARLAHIERALEGIAARMK